MKKSAIPLCLALLALTGCSGPTQASTPTSAPTYDKYAQTWAKEYKDTSCDDWRNKMTSRQQFAAAADILTAARNKIDGGSGMPTDSLVTEFEDGISRVCVIPSMTLTDATYGLYKTEARFHP